MTDALTTDMDFSDLGLQVFLTHFKEQLGIRESIKLSGEVDWKSCKDCIFLLTDNHNVHTSYRFRRATTKKGKDVYGLQDITFRSQRPSGQKCDLHKMNAKWFLYGVLTKDQKKLSRGIIVKLANAFEDYIILHPEILTQSIPNEDGSSTFQGVKIKDIPSEYVIWKYDYQESLKLSDFR